MKIILAIQKKYPNSLEGKKILVCTHATDATVSFLKIMSDLGAKIFYIPISYSKNQISINNIHKINNLRIIEPKTLDRIISDVDIIIEDGMRISQEIHNNHKLKDTLYSIEQTTSGIRKFEKSNLLYPVINVAESKLKLEIENSIATPESILTSLLFESRISLTQKNVLVIGYGKVGSGIAKLCHCHGSNVTIVDNDVLKRAIAKSHGFHTVNSNTINENLNTQDIIISCTANRDGFCLGVEQFLLMKDKTMLVNAGSGRGEISEMMLNTGKFNKNKAKINITKNNDHLYCTLTKMGLKKQITILGSAHPINLRCGNGTPTEMMDFVFSVMLLTAIKTKPESLETSICLISQDIQKEIVILSEHVTDLLQANLIQNNKLSGEDRPWGKLFRFSSSQDLKNFSLVRATFEPNCTTEGHYHAVSEEAYVVESGTADIFTWNPKNIDDKTTFNVKPGDYLSIPKGMAHKVIVTSQEKFSCLVIASPPFSFWDQFFPKVSTLQKV